MIVNTQGVEVNDTNYISEAGHYVFKIVKFEEDGYNKFKLTFVGNKMLVVDGKATLDDVKYTHTENYSLDDNLLWKIKILEIALEAPEVYDVNNFVGRYVRADVSLREYNGKMYSNIEKWIYSKQNDSLAPIPKASQEQSNGTSQPSQSGTQDSLPVIDVSEDDIPFAPIGLQYPMSLFVM